MILLLFMLKVISINLAYTEQRHIKLWKMPARTYLHANLATKKTRTWTSEYYKSMGITNCLYWWNGNGWDYFAPAVVPLITRLRNSLASTILSRLVVYLVPMLFVCMNYWFVGVAQEKTPVIELKEFRKRIGVLDTEYTRTDNLKMRVIELALKQINDHTDITASYEQHKKGEWLQDSHSSLSRRSPNKSKLPRKQPKQPRMTKT